MRTYIFILLFTCLSHLSFSQKRSHFNFADVNVMEIVGVVEYNLDNKPIDTSYVLGGRDVRYEYISEYVTVKIGTLAEIKDFISQCLNIIKTEELNVSLTHEGIDIYVIYKDKKALSIHDMDKYSGGYIYITEFELSQFLKFIDMSSKRMRITIR